MKTVKVRIAAAVDANGKWCAYGSSTSDFDDLVLDDLEPGEARYWIEAELSIPETGVVQAAVAERFLVTRWEAPGAKAGDRIQATASDGRSGLAEVEGIKDEMVYMRWLEPAAPVQSGDADG